MASTKITRTQVTGSTNGTKIFTISVWFKLATITTTQSCIWSSGTASTDSIDLHVDATNQLTFESWDGSSNPKLQLSRKLRDAGAWYHVVLAVDSTEAVDTNRLKMWVNGVQETAFGSSTYPTLNYEFPGTGVASDVTTIGVGTQGSYTGNYFNGEMSHFHFIEGTAYAASTFGETDSTSGIWKIKTSPSVTYGNNGFFLKMEDRTNLDLDSSPNALTFTTTGTGTATYDNPSNSFCTLNPSDNYYPASTFSNGNNTIVTHSSNYSYNTGTMGLSAGLWYWEEKIGSSSSYDLVGIADSPTLSADGWLGYYTYSYGYRSDTGQVYTATSGTAYGGTYTTGDIIGVYLDLNANKLYFAKNGTLENSGTGVSITAAASTTHGHYFPGVGEYGSSSAGTYNLNFGNGYFGTTAVTSAVADAGGEGAFEYDPSSGTFDGSSKDFRAICTNNIATYGG